MTRPDPDGPIDPVAWVAAVHAHLAERSVEEPGADWGTVVVRHRTTRPEWFGPYATAWARPVPVGSANHGIDLCSGAVADLADVIGPPPRPGHGVRIDRAAHDGTVTAWDPASGRAVVVRVGAPDEYEQVTPLRPLVHWAALADGGVLVHAAVVARRFGADAARGLLVVGEAGFGKSTTTAAALGAGWVTAGDDAVLVRPDTGRWLAHGVYGAVKTKLDGDHPDLPVAATRSWTVGGRKWVHLLSGTDANHLAAVVDLVGVVVLDPTADPDAPVVAVSGARARTATAPSTVGALPDRQAEVLSRIGAVCGALPAFVLPRRVDLTRTVVDLDTVLDAADPHVGVVIPVFDGSAFVADAIHSVTTQSVGRCRIVVVDDASTDDSVAVVEQTRAAVEHAGHQLVVLRADRNRGVAATRNRGIAENDLPFVAFLDQDDAWTPDHVARLRLALHRSDADVAYGRVRYADVAGDADRPWLRDRWFDGDHPGHVFGAGLFRRGAFARIGPVAEGVGMFDDVDWYLRLRDSGLPPVTIDDVVLERHIHTANQSRLASRDAAGLLHSVRDHLARKRAAVVELDVVIPVRNGVTFIADAVRSALDQEQTDTHIVVVDDASTDGTADLVASWADPRVTVVRLTEPHGIGGARNAGAAVGQRPWLAFLDADDVWPTDRTRLLAAAVAADPDALAIGQVHATDDPTAPVSAAGRAAAPAAVLAGGILGRRAIFDRVGPYDESLRVGEFVEWLARARVLGVREVPVPVLSLVRRLHPDSTTHTRRDDYGDYLRAVAMVRARQR